MAASRGVLRQITELETMSRPELQARWRELLGTEPPAGYRRETLFRRLAYRVQELAFGGLSEATRARLREHLEPADGLDADTSEVARLERRRRRDGMPVAGTRLAREWRGRRHEVTVVPGGFEFAGRRYRSLSAVARAITGAHWNGPAFFGLRKPGRKGGS